MNRNPNEALNELELDKQVTGKKAGIVFEVWDLSISKRRRPRKDQTGSDRIRWGPGRTQTGSDRIR